MSSEAALQDEISRLSGAINRQRGGQPAARRGRGSGWRGTAPYNKSYRSTFTTEYDPLLRPSLSSSSVAKQEVVLDGVIFQSNGRSLIKKTSGELHFGGFYSRSWPLTSGRYLWIANSGLLACLAEPYTLSTDTAPGVTPATVVSSSSMVVPAPVPINSSSPTIGAAKPLVRTRNGLIAANRFKSPAVTRLTKQQPRYPPVVTGYPKRAAPGRNLTLNKKAVKTKRKTLDKQCKHFTRTGMCGRGLTCKYQHDPSKVALCALFLAERCPFAFNPSGCSLSHDPTPERTPLCTRFNSTGQCYKGSDCLYPHIRVGPKKGVCRDFAVLGYCDKGALCEASHLKECPDFAETGICSRMGLKGAGGCHLPHVIRANQTRIGTVNTMTSNSTNEAVNGKRKADDVVVDAGWDVSMNFQPAGHSASSNSTTLPLIGNDVGDEFISLTIVESEEEDDEDSDDESGGEEEEDEADDQDEERTSDAAPIFALP